MGQFDLRLSGYTVVVVSIVKAWDSLSVGKDTLIVLSALQVSPSNSPHRSLRKRVVERIVQLHDESTSSPRTQIVIATSPLSGPNALTLSAVSLTWFAHDPSMVSSEIDIVSMSYSLWTPSTPTSRFYLYADCFKTAARLVEVSLKTPRPLVGS